MTENKHTPGPWDVFESPGLVSVMKANCNDEVVHWAGFDSSHFPEQNLANAHLIAAAPELLMALESIIDGFDSGMFVRDVSRDAQPNWALEMMKLVRMLADAKQAIAKAKGEL